MHSNSSQFPAAFQINHLNVNPTYWQDNVAIFQWHAEFNLPVKITEPKRETVMTYDINGRLLSRTVQTRNN